MQKHFIGKLSEGPDVQRVISLISHSDGIDSFCDTFAPGERARVFNKNTDYAYCCTLAVELKAKQGPDGAINIERSPLHVIHN